MSQGVLCIMTILNESHYLILTKMTKGVIIVERKDA